MQTEVSLALSHLLERNKKCNSFFFSKVDFHNRPNILYFYQCRLVVFPAYRLKSMNSEIEETWVCPTNFTSYKSRHFWLLSVEPESNSFCILKLLSNCQGSKLGFLHAGQICMTAFTIPSRVLHKKLSALHHPVTFSVDYSFFTYRNFFLYKSPSPTDVFFPSHATECSFSLLVICSLFINLAPSGWAPCGCNKEI